MSELRPSLSQVPQSPGDVTYQVGGSRLQQLSKVMQSLQISSVAVAKSRNCLCMSRPLLQLIGFESGCLVLLYCRSSVHGLAAHKQDGEVGLGIDNL